MIRINLLRQNILATTSVPGRLGLVVGTWLLVCILVVGTGWWWWRLTEDVTAKQRQAGKLQQETQRLAEVQRQVAQYEKLKQLLDSRISVIERLKKNQTGPSNLLEVIRESVPERPTLWLTDMSQKGNRVTLDGRSFDVPSIADLIVGLNRSELFGSVELVYWQEEDPAIKFQLNCTTK